MPDWEYIDDSQPSQPTAPKAGGWEYLDAVPARREINGVEAARAVFPDITPTSGYRGPNHPLSKKNPKSFHALTHRAVDLPPIPGMTFEQAAAKFREQGYTLNPDSRDEVNNPVSWQTGPNWHFVFDGGPESGITQSTVTTTAEPEKPVPASWEYIDHNGIPETEVGRRNERGSMQTETIDDEFKGLERSDRMVIGDYSAANNDYVEGFVTTAKGNNIPFADVEKDLVGRFGKKWYSKNKTSLRHYYDTGAPLRWVGNPNDPALDTNVGEDITVVGGKAPTDLELKGQYLSDRAEQGYRHGMFGLYNLASNLVGQDETTKDELIYQEKLARAELENRLEKNYLGHGNVADEVVGFGADMAGGLGPDALLPAAVGKAPLTRALSAPILAAGVDAAQQKAEQKLGLQGDFSYERNLLAAGTGGALQAGGEAISHSLQSKYDSAGTNYRTFDNPKVIETSEGGTGAPVRGKRVPPSQAKKLAIGEEISRVTKDWADSPEIVVHASKKAFDKAEPELSAKVSQDGADKARAFYDDEGRIHILGHNVKDVGTIESTIFHEALGHYGMAKQYGDELDNLLQNLYDKNYKIKKETDALSKTTKYGDIYASTGSPTARLVEEVLAIRSENGVLSKNIADKFSGMIRTFGRDMGLDLRISDREVKTFLADAHDAVINKERDGTPSTSGLKYMRVYHGSPHEFSNSDPENPHGRFDATKIGTGEGVQAYGHGLYLTETRDIAEMYRKNLSGESEGGRVYEVDLPDDMKWLAWDFQPEPHQKDALNRLGIEYASRDEVKSLYDEYYVAQQKMMDAEDALSSLKDKKLQFLEGTPESKKSFGEGLTPEYQRELSKLRDAETAVMFLQHEIDNAAPHGEVIYRKLVKSLGSAEEASKALKEAGFDGVKYLDGFSRDMGEGSSNYVVFDDSKPKIINKYQLEAENLPQKTVAKFMTAMKGAKFLNEEYTARVKSDRAAKIKALKAARATGSGEAGFRKELSALKGETQKSYIEPFREKFSKREAKTLFDYFKNHPDLTWFEGIRARQALMKLFEGEVPNKSDLQLLSVVLPKDFVKYALELRTKGMKAKDIFEEAVNLPRALMSSIDFSAPFRQGIFLVGRKEYWKALPQMFKHAFSEEYHDVIRDEIRSRDTYPLMEEAGLELTEMGGIDASLREEDFQSKIALKVPGVKGSNRAYVGFLNKLRADVFDSLIKDGSKVGVDFMNDVAAAKSLAKYINTATGRGHLGKVPGLEIDLKKSATLLNGIFFSPKLMASRISLLNPVFYRNLHPFVRKQAVKDLSRTGSIITTILALASYAGLDVETDPRSSDFLKIRDGKTRYDITGGFSNYLTLAARVFSNSTKTLKGEIKTLGKGQNDTQLDVLGRFFRSKSAPVPAYVMNFLEGENVVGEKFSFTKDTLGMFTPLFVQDVIKGYKDEGAVGAVKKAPSVVGITSNTYEFIPYKYDSYGRDVDTVYEKDEAIDEIERLNTAAAEDGTPLVKSELLEHILAKNLPEAVADRNDQSDIDLMQKVSSEYLLSAWREFIQTEEYKSMSDEERVKSFRDLKKKAREDARMDLWPKEYKGD